MITYLQYQSIRRLLLVLEYWITSTDLLVSCTCTLHNYVLTVLEHSSLTTSTRALDYFDRSIDELHVHMAELHDYCVEKGPLPERLARVFFSQILTGTVLFTNPQW